MSSTSVHHQFIKENGEITVHFSKFFTKGEISFLSKYYNWGLGLVNGNIPPITIEQENFIATFHKHIKDKETPPYRTDIWYSNLNPMQKAWVKYFYIQLLCDGVLDYTVDHNSLNIFESSESKTPTKLNHSKKKTTTRKKQKTKQQPVKKKGRKCISCGVYIGYSKNYKCINCFVPTTKKKKPKRGSITSKRMTFNRTKWNDDSYER